MHLVDCEYKVFLHLGFLDIVFLQNVQKLGGLPEGEPAVLTARDMLIIQGAVGNPPLTHKDREPAPDQLFQVDGLIVLVF